jgi:hypothetical protein
MDREQLLAAITNGSADDDMHIQSCLNMLENESDDLLRTFARLWLQHNSVALARRAINHHQL